MRRIPTEQDKFIGQRIREARIAGRHSQKDLADMLGVSYQQIQKYENGHNRIAGARMGRLMVALNRPFAYFFPTTADIRDAPTLLSALLATKDGQQIAKDFPRLPPQYRRLVVQLVAELAKEQP